MKHQNGHNVTATLLCLFAGVVTAFVVAGYVVFGTLDGLRDPWGAPAWIFVATTVFAAANVVWALAGFASMQRLTRTYAERTGRTFDSVPAIHLFVAIALLIAAILQTITL